MLEFLDTDLEAIIYDKSLLFQPGDIKSWMYMTMRGLDHCHRNWVLHRVGHPTSFRSCSCVLGLIRCCCFATGLKAEQLVDCTRRSIEIGRLWFGKRIWGSQDSYDPHGRHKVIQRFRRLPRSCYRLKDPANYRTDGIGHLSCCSAVGLTEQPSTSGQQDASLPRSCSESPSWQPRRTWNSWIRSFRRSARRLKKTGRCAELALSLFWLVVLNSVSTFFRISTEP